MGECLVLICDVCLVVGGGEGESPRISEMIVWWLVMVRMG